MSADVQAPGAPLQFDSAVSSAPSASGSACTACQAPIRSLYFEADGQVVCPRCRQGAESALAARGTRAGRVARAALLGLGGAMGGALLYFGVAALTGYEIGLVAIAVGYLVGLGVRTGSGGRGGWRYQAMAIVLTQLAIGVAYFGQGMREAAKDGRAAAVAAADSSTRAAAAPGDAAGDTTRLAGGTPGASETAAPRGGALSLALGLVALAGFVFALPVIAGVSEFPQHAMGLVIVAIALHQAWVLNRRAQVAFTGPYHLARADGGAAATPDAAPSHG